jgi:hypothetical protein
MLFAKVFFASRKIMSIESDFNRNFKNIPERVQKRHARKVNMATREASAAAIKVLTYLGCIRSV